MRSESANLEDSDLRSGSPTFEITPFSFDSSFSRCIHSACCRLTWGTKRWRRRLRTRTGLGRTRQESMNFLSRVLRFLFWLLVLSWSVTAAAYVVAWMMRAPQLRPQPARVWMSPGHSKRQDLARRLVRDPVCGVHVAEVLAIPLRDGGETLHFCSIACRDEYASARSEHRKIAAKDRQIRARGFATMIEFCGRAKCKQSSCRVIPLDRIRVTSPRA